MLGTEDDGTKSSLVTVCVCICVCMNICAHRCVCMSVRVHVCVCLRMYTACRSFRCLGFLTRNSPSQQGQRGPAIYFSLFLTAGVIGTSSLRVFVCLFNLGARMAAQ